MNAFLTSSYTSGSGEPCASSINELLATDSDGLKLLRTTLPVGLVGEADPGTRTGLEKDSGGSGEARSTSRCAFGDDGGDSPSDFGI